VVQLTIQAHDMGTPPGISPENVRITVTVARNLHSPRFQSTPYRASLPRNQGLDVPVIDAIASDDDKYVSLVLSLYFFKLLFSLDFEIFADDKELQVMDMIYFIYIR